MVLLVVNRSPNGTERDRQTLHTNCPFSTFLFPGDPGRVSSRAGPKVILKSPNLFPKDGSCVLAILGLLCFSPAAPAADLLGNHPVHELYADRALAHRGGDSLGARCSHVADRKDPGQTGLE